MIIEEGYLGYLKYDGKAVEDGIMDACDSATALLGFDEAFRYFIQKENPSWEKEDLNLPVRIERGCWEIMVPAGLTVFAGYYLKATAEKAGSDGLFETGFAKDLNKVLGAALISFTWVMKISKHVGGVGDKLKLENAKLQDVDNCIVFSDENEPLIVPRKFFELYQNCPPTLFSKCAKNIDEGRELEIGLFERGEIVDAIRIYPEEKFIFYQEKDDVQEVLFPELEHGMVVELEGEITRVTESENTLGFRYQDHVLSCKPEHGEKIASFKHKIISQQDNHIFPKVKIIGVVDRKDKNDEFKAHRPSIVFSDIQRIETVEGTLFNV